MQKLPSKKDVQYESTFNIKNIPNKTKQNKYANKQTRGKISKIDSFQK